MEKEVSKVYLINGVARFSPEKRLITTINKDREFILYGTATRCLLTLIEHAGQIVSHNQLYQAGWKSHGKDATPNTLYQTISEIRKHFYRTGLENIITTQPRRGWIIKSNVVIVALNEEQEPPPALHQQPEPRSFWKKLTQRIFSL